MAVMKGGFVGNKPIKAMYKGQELIWQKQEEGGIPSYYELATDDDFRKVSDGRFEYKGNKEYIILPELIQGEPFNLRFMFSYNGKIKGVAGKASESGSATGAFRNVYSREVELIYLDTSNITDMSRMFQDSRIEVLDLSSFNISNVTSTYYMFFGAEAEVGYARTQEDADKFNNSDGKPSGLTFVVKG